MTGTRSQPPFASPSAKPSNPRPAIPIPDELVELVAERAAEILAERQPAVELAPYLSVDEAAEYLRCSRKRIYDLTSQRRLPAVKDGSRTLLRRVDLDAYLEGAA